MSYGRSLMLAAAVALAVAGTLCCATASGVRGISATEGDNEGAGNVLTLNNPQYAHCFLLQVIDGKGWKNEYMQAHGYQYQPPQWTPGPCPAKYNYFNRDVMIADGVKESTYGVANNTAFVES